MELYNILLFTKIQEEKLFDNSTIVEYAKVSNELVSTMLKLKGIGLAANQIGLRYRAFAMLIDDVPEVLFNPQIITFCKGIEVNEEGCLSYPGKILLKARMPEIEVWWKNCAGAHRKQWLKGIEARCFQHELDHLNGKDWEND